MNSDVTKKLTLAVFISVTLMAFLLYGIDWKHFSSIADRVRMDYLIIAFAILIIANIIRSFRFYTMDHVGKKLSSWLIINKLYNFMTATLPGGVGEAATAYLIQRYSRFNMLSSFRILLLSRVMDLAAFSALLFFVATQISEDIYYRETAIWLSGALLLVSIILLVPATEHLILKLMQRLPGENRIMQRVHKMLSELVSISDEYREKNSFGIILIQSVLIIIGSALSLHFVLLSFGTGFELLNSFYCVGVYALFQMVPVQGIAGIGTQAAWWSIALNVAGYREPDVVALGIILHATFYAFITLMGLLAVIIWLLSPKSIFKT